MRSADGRFAGAADRAHCRSRIRVGSRSFYAASILLPAPVREAAYALYAFCRFSDDLVDLGDGGQRAIAHLRHRLDQAYAGTPAGHPIDRAFADMILRFGMPRALPEALIEGLAWDVEGVRCDGITDLYAYAARVAGSVGAMMCVLMGIRDAAVVSRACNLGIAMQLTNIARDVGEDARAGRLYLPRAWLREAGQDPDAWLADPKATPAVRATVTRLIETAEGLYGASGAAIAHLPRRCRPAIFAARHLYREIGLEVLNREADSVSDRARVPGSRKLALMAQAVKDAVTTARRPLSGRGLPEAAFLVEAVRHAPPAAGPAIPPLGPFARRVLWVAELFAALEARQRQPG